MAHKWNLHGESITDDVIKHTISCSCRGFGGFDKSFLAWNLFFVFRVEIMQQAEMTVDEDSLTSYICFLNNEFLF